MPNNTRTKPDVDWVDEYAPTPAEWRSIDTKVFGSWNGDRGGAYASSDVGGALFSKLTVEGPFRISAGYLRGPEGAFVIPTGTWPQLSADHIGRVRRIVQPILGFNSTHPHLWSRNHAYAGVGSIALAAKFSFSKAIEKPDLFLPLRVIDGALLRELEVNFRVALPRQKAPIAMPKIRILRRRIFGGDPTPEPLKSTEDGTGFASPPLVDQNQWYAGGVNQKFTYVCDQNHRIDVAEFVYLVHIVEEEGIRTINDEFDGICFVERKNDVDLRDTVLDPANPGGGILNRPDDTLNTLPFLGAYTDAGPSGSTVYRFDGVPVDIGDDETDVPRRRILVANHADEDENASHLNGIWTQPIYFDAVSQPGEFINGEWMRTADLQATDDFSPNWFVLVKSGFSDGGGVFQCQSPTNRDSIKLWMNNQFSKRRVYNLDGSHRDELKAPNAIIPANASAISITPAKPRGNIYHSVVPTFEVADLRFQ